MRERVPDYHYASEQSKALIETLRMPVWRQRPHSKM